MEETTVLNGDKPEKDEGRDETGRFVPGSKQGRPKGSVSAAVALRDRFILTILKLDKEPEYDGDYVFYFAKKFPDKFMTLVASLLPKQLKIEAEHHHIHVAVMDLPEADRARVFDECRQRIVEIRGTEVIEQKDVKVLEVEPSDHP